MPTTPAEPVTVRRSATHGRGLYATRPLQAGELATEAHAVVLDQRSSDALCDHLLASYLVGWDDRRSAVPFGPLSFVNHDEDPNAELVVDHTRTTVQLVTRRPVGTGQELTVDYGPDHPL